MTALLSRSRKRPLILITADFEENPSQPTEGLCTVRRNYCAAILAAGGLPLILPCLPEAAEAALAIAGGLLVSGTRPGEDAHPERRAVEIALIGRALDLKLPLLGICNGMQLLGEVLGGRIDRDNPQLLAQGSVHMPSDVPSGRAHDLVLLAGSCLAAWAEGATTTVNSLHRHALCDGGRFRVLARAPDGVIEAIEGPGMDGSGAGFCLGVQWHPEYLLSPLDIRILSDFVRKSAARNDLVNGFGGNAVAPEPTC